MSHILRIKVDPQHTRHKVQRRFQVGANHLEDNKCREGQNKSNRSTNGTPACSTVFWCNMNCQTPAPNPLVSNLKLRGLGLTLKSHGPPHSLWLLHIDSGSSHRLWLHHIDSGSTMGVHGVALSVGKVFQVQVDSERKDMGQSQNVQVEHHQSSFLSIKSTSTILYAWPYRPPV